MPVGWVCKSTQTAGGRGCHNSCVMRWDGPFEWLLTSNKDEAVRCICLLACLRHLLALLDTSTLLWWQHLLTPPPHRPTAHPQACTCGTPGSKVTSKATCVSQANGL